MNTAKLRETFLEYFKKNGHEVVPSSLLVPENDPTLLFTNAGMVPFKNVFLGTETRKYTRAVSSQRCVRAGGKHNDLENVGFTARHHTFFEMLGNFSFGDYFKREAINYAWDFITKELKIPEDRLWVTVYEEDQEAEDIWLNEIGVAKARFSQCGAQSNFWSMGEVGPCGPCSEIFYDHGSEVDGGPPGTPEEDGDRYVEIWNLVFMQFNRDIEGNLSPLPKTAVDTGMGLERIAAVMQGVHSNYEIDIFANLIQAIAKVVGTKAIKDIKDKSLRVIADHLRASAFLVADGVLPSNEGRGYVLRRIMRRAIRYGHTLDQKDVFFYKLVPHLVKEMGQAFPVLIEKQQFIVEVFAKEEQQFSKTLDQGMKIILAIISENTDKTKPLPGEVAFKLYDTYGFPLDLTKDIAREHGMVVDTAGFEAAMAAQKQRARKAHKFSVSTPKIQGKHESEFVGYEHLAIDSEILEIFKDGALVDSLAVGEAGMVVLDKTPFYAESGGQVGDRGELILADNVFAVKVTQVLGNSHVQVGEVKSGEFRVGQKVDAVVDSELRASIVINHSATHLLHAVLRQKLGKHVEQKGSAVAAERLRFDFSNPEPLSQELLLEMEKAVNEKIRENTVIKTKVMPIDEARRSGAMALFGEKYADEVRVLEMGSGFSVELCGGTHAVRTGDIGLFKIISETGVAAGVRRIEAVTGAFAIAELQKAEKQLLDLAEMVKTNKPGLADRVKQLQAKIKTLEVSLEQMQKELLSGNSSNLVELVREVKGIKILATKLPVSNVKALRDTMDKLKNQLGTAVIVLATVNDDKITLIAGVTKNCISRLKANELASYVANQVGGKGGGRADMAQAGGDQPENLDSALESVFSWIESKV